MEYVWITFGTLLKCLGMCLECCWNGFDMFLGICLECVWAFWGNVFELCLEWFWNVCGILLECCLWKVFPTVLGHVF